MKRWIVLRFVFLIAIAKCVKPLASQRTYEKHGVAQNPWEQGYALAGKLRETLGLNGHLLPTDEDLAKALDTDGQTLHAAIQASPDAVAWNLIGLVGPATNPETNPDNNPAFIIGRARAETRRFALCQAICEYILDPGKAGQPGQAAIITNAQTRRQQTNRAFAAEFLAPVHVLQKYTGIRTPTKETFENLAA